MRDHTHTICRSMFVSVNCICVYLYADYRPSVMNYSRPLNFDLVFEYIFTIFTMSSERAMNYVHKNTQTYTPTFMQYCHIFTEPSHSFVILCLVCHLLLLLSQRLIPSMCHFLSYSLASSTSFPTTFLICLFSSYLAASLCVCSLNF